MQHSYAICYGAGVSCVGLLSYIILLLYIHSYVINHSLAELQFFMNQPGWSHTIPLFDI